ncbi:MAG: amidohydrolase [Phycisphaeraceae bacterium]|nr:amidohydrolase [Phycisphaeraceae bacterium]
MIIDVHTHAWNAKTDFSRQFTSLLRSAAGIRNDALVSDYADYRAHAPNQTISIVFGGKARLAGIWVDDQDVARYAAQDPKRLVPFMALDPTQDGWLDEMRHGRDALGLRGIKLMPMYAGFMPDDSRLDPMWHYAGRHRLPVLLHTGTTIVPQGPLEMTLPRRLDAVATRFPEVRIILAHLGHPYEGECVAMIRKHPNVYADVSALYYRPFQLYQSLMLVQEYGVWHKLLFGTDYPFTRVNDTIEGLLGLNAMLEGTALPRLDEKAMRAMIERDTLRVLQLRRG